MLSHRLEDGSERPIAFASRSLSPAGKGYAQLDKEALAIVFGVTKFHVYLYGHSFTIHSDHKALHIISLVHINTQFLISQDLRWLMQMY